jgi:hypothetical protein
MLSGVILFVSGYLFCKLTLKKEEQPKKIIKKFSSPLYASKARNLESKQEDTGFDRNTGLYNPISTKGVGKKIEKVNSDG